MLCVSSHTPFTFSLMLSHLYLSVVRYFFIQLLSLMHVFTLYFLNLLNQGKTEYTLCCFSIAPTTWAIKNSVVDIFNF